jgi:acetyl esterase/lipase
LKKILLCSVLGLLSTLSIAQQKKIPLDHNVYLLWKNLKHQIISNDGKWVSYEKDPLKGDGWLFIYNMQTGKSDSVPRGCDAVFSPNSDYISFTIKQPEDSVRKAKLAKKKDDELPKDSLGIKILGTEKLVKIPGVKSFKVPAEKGSWMAYQFEKEPEKKESKEKDTTAVKKDEKPKTDKKKKKQNGTDLVLYEPISMHTLRFKFVTDYSIANEGSLLAFATQRKDSLDSTAVVVFRVKNEKADTVFLAQGEAKKTAIDRAGKQLAFLFSADTGKSKVYDLYFFDEQKNKTKLLADSLNPAFPKGWTVSENTSPSFSRTGDLLIFGTAPRPKPEPKDTLLDEEKLKVDIWNWNDGRLQSQQLKELDKDKKKTWTAIYRIPENKIIQIADKEMDQVNLADENSNLALGISELPYEKLSSWESPDYRDIYRIDLQTGQRKIVLKKQQYSYYFSPFGNYLVYWNSKDSIWYSVSLADGVHHALTKSLKEIFWNEENDMPEESGPYGAGGWYKHDKYVLIYDRWDIWKMDPSGKEKPVNLTNGFGRKTRTILRYIKLNKDLSYIDSVETMLLKAFEKDSKKEGYCTIAQNNTKDPKRLLIGNRTFDGITKAKNSSAMIFTSGTFVDYPDLYKTQNDFKEIKIISHINPQQSNYLWGRVELVKWNATDGTPLDGLLFKPANFDSTAQYPMIVYFYERYSDLLNNHWIPSPSRSTINPSFYTSNGYVVFMPDIRYKTGYPGQSAVNAIVSGTKYILSKRFVDPARVGIQGQSWGGYQVAYLVGQTDMFAAAMAGAAVTDMISAYGGIRWESGLSRAFQYEEQQSRIGGSLWEKRELFIENSPVFFADKVKTPLLMMNNDNDGAVPWYQGIEFFTDLRRLGKPVWMLNYNGDSHNLEKWVNRVDLSIRMKEFFDHYLKNGPMPEWMSVGVPALDKGIKTGY